MEIPGLIKYEKMPKILLNTVSVCFWIAITLTIICFTFSIIVHFLPQNFSVINPNSNGTFGLSPDNIIRFTISAKNIDELDLNPLYSSFLLGIAMLLLLITIVLKQLKGILKNVIHNLPFAQENAKGILNIGYSVIAGSLLGPFSRAYLINKIVAVFDFQNIKAVYTLNIEALFIGILLILLSAIFHYGAYLQEEHDTTL